MARSTRGPLRVPALLAVSAIAAACGDGDKTTMTTAGTTAGTTEAATETSSGASSGTLTTGMLASSTGAPTTGDTGDLPNCGMYKDLTSCMMVPGCEFIEIGECIVACMQLTDEATCESQPYCGWFDGKCTTVLS